MADNASEKKVSFKDTLNLPRTDFPIRPNAKEDDPQMLDRWDKEKLYEKTFELNKGKQQFILHDGPPYANGHIHIGHAYNKILKDIITKSQRMLGKHVPVTPGWDCHGLPIELKVSKENQGASPQELKKACRKYAQQWIDTQRAEFKRLGVLMDWDNPYQTMNFEYESAILKAFSHFVADGYIERKNKTVPWCPSCQTVLASAEIEYQERKDPSIYVRFPLTPDTVSGLAQQIEIFDKEGHKQDVLAGKEVSFLVWTTTPWTLPLNRAVLLKPKSEYVILDIKGDYIIVGKQLADKICAMLDIEKKEIATFSSDDLGKIGPQAQHPFVEDLIIPVILDNSVLLDDGTACVHSAPGCGPDDYEVGVKNNLEIFSPISPDGTYTVGIVPKELEGMPVADGQIWVIKKIAGNGTLLHKASIRHPYPHCWRCHNGLIFRATKQWFCDLSRSNLKTKVLQAIDGITTIPEKSVNRLKATVDGRLEWCLSRQRVWGVPIPSLLCIKCDYTYITPGLIEKVAAGVEKEGIEFWDNVDPHDLLPKGFACPLCTGTEFKKEKDILDVWFDSGVSHSAVLYENDKLGFPADLYLEGKDQHRGWFQSSLLTSMVLHGKAPMKTILTHGFTVDKKGHKMSKSVGNVVAPQEMIDKIGTDGLRLWVSSIDCAGDAVVSDVLTKNVGQVFRKIRNTCRFLLSNMYDFDFEKDAVPLDKMMPIDRYALQQLYVLNSTIIEHYKAFDFTAIFHALGDYCTVNLSSFYLDIVKDRLYVEKSDGLPRRSAQTVCWYILDTLTRLVAPIMSFTAEQLTDNFQKNKTESIHLQEFASLDNVWSSFAKYYQVARPDHPALESVTSHVERMNFITKEEAQWKLLKDIRSAILKAIEGLREQGTIKHSLEARVTVHLQEDTIKEALRFFINELGVAGKTMDAFFKEFLIVSQFEVADSPDGLAESELKGLHVKVEKAQGDKCPRCWNWDETDHEHKLCRRCQSILS